jgi:hypothetical protein
VPFCHWGLASLPQLHRWQRRRIGPNTKPGMVSKLGKVLEIGLVVGR